MMIRRSIVIFSLIALFANAIENCGVCDFVQDRNQNAECNCFCEEDLKYKTSLDLNGNF